jgi:hypothetical protein
MSRFPSFLLGFALLVSACAATPSPAGTVVVGPPVVISGDVPEVLDAAARADVELLVSAEVFFPSGHGGWGGVDAGAEALRRLVAGQHTAGVFLDIIERGTPAGQMYGLAGLYFADPAAYEVEVRRLVNDTTEVTTQRGCIRMSESISSLMLSPHSASRSELRTGESLTSYSAAHPDHGHADFAGGGAPLRQIGWDRAAIRDPLLR